MTADSLFTLPYKINIHDIKARADVFQLTTDGTDGERMAFTAGAFWALEESKAAELEAENQSLRYALELASAFIEARLSADIKDIGISVQIEK